MPAGRKEGQIINPRDSQGWMIPREGTKRRKVYDLMVEGKQPNEICEVIGISKMMFAVNKHYIQHTDQANARELRNRRRWGH